MSRTLSAVPPLPGRFQFSPEFQLLLACSWIAPELERAAQGASVARLSSEVTDWAGFLALVHRHKLISVAYTLLVEHAGDLVPSEIRTELKKQKLLGWKTALVYATELLRLNKEFQGEGIDLLPLKGITLSLRLFGDPGMRHVRDLDLLVRPEDVDRADRILGATGYQRVAPQLESSPGRRKLQLRHERHFEYYRADLQVRIELHWRWEMLSAERVSDLWRHSVAMKWQGQEIKILDDEALLLTLCDHGALHRFTRIKWLSDCVMMLTVEGGCDWDRLLKSARHFDCERPLAQVAILARWLYGNPLPDPLCKLVQSDKSAARMAAQAVEAMLGDQHAGNLNDPQRGRSFFEYTMRAPAEYIESFRYTMSLRKRSGLRSSLTRDLIRSADFDALPLPDRLLWLYYVLRPFLWLWRHK
jgi:hypothetical protein